MRRVQLRIVQNTSERRLEEFDFTRRLALTLQAHGIEIDPDAQHALEGEIVDITEPRGVEGPRETLLVGTYQVRFRLVLRDLSTGNPVGDVRETTEAASYAPARGRTPETARQEVFDRVARWAVRQLEATWGPAR